MICLRCRDMHAGNDLAHGDHGVALALGDCPRGGARHEWRPGNFVMDMPVVSAAGEYRVRPIDLAEARAFVRAPLVMSCLRLAWNSRLLSALLDTPLVYHTDPHLPKMDVGDKALAVLPLPGAKMVNINSFKFKKDYDLLMVERVA